MARKKTEDLKPLAISNLKKPGLHFVGYVSGLAIRISKTGKKFWILRVSIGGKRCDLGLGAHSEISLTQAKTLALDIKQKVKNGINPINEKKEAKAALKADQASFITFEQAANLYIDAHKQGWRNPKHHDQWANTLKMYAFPVIGKMHLRDVSLEHVLKILEPIWREKTETASRLRGRIESILDWGAVRGFRNGENPARWKGNLNMLLPAKSKIAPVKHHRTIQWYQAPQFINELRKQEGNSAKCLEFLLLTNTRSGEARKARWIEFDIPKRIWTIPAGRMKGGIEHRVPLSDTAVKILEGQMIKEFSENDIVFPNTQGNELSDMAMTMVIRRMNWSAVLTTHGLRSTFRDWAGEVSNFPREVIEHALSHKIPDKVEAAYARGTLFTKRIKLMNAWAEFLEKGSQSEENVTPINRKRNV